MIERISSENIDTIKNPAFRAYAQRYVDIDQSFREAVASQGLPFAPVDAVDNAIAEPAPESAPASVPEFAPASVPEFAPAPESGVAPTPEPSVADAPEPATPAYGCAREHEPLLPPELAPHVDRELIVENDGKSFHINWLSDACVNCRHGLFAKTYLISTQCPRHCFFCFNPNQDGYDYFRTNINDVVAELEHDHDQGARFTHIALTGGEPLMHADESVKFFERAHELYPDAHLRLYTSGAYLDESLMKRLGDAGLTEIRFSIKTDDPTAVIDDLFQTMELSKNYIDDVMVEMPIIPGELDTMKDILTRLDAIGARGINLLELGFPLANADEFARRGLRLKANPMRVLYNYDYAGGIPVDQSEEDCLALLSFAIDNNLSLGVHYCSMENKHTGQIYQQNARSAKNYPRYVMSTRDNFLKTVKVFGNDAQTLSSALKAANVDPSSYSRPNGYLEIDPRVIRLLAAPADTANRASAPDSTTSDNAPTPAGTAHQALTNAPALDPDIELAVSYNVVEDRDGDLVLREVRIDRTTLGTFDPRTDL